MDSTTAALLATLAAYLIGSLPFGFLTARLVTGIDIRKAGSGNIGATNVARVLGAKWGALVLVLDLLKGLLPVLLLPHALRGADHPDFLHVQVACGLATCSTSSRRRSIGLPSRSTTSFDVRSLARKP